MYLVAKSRVLIASGRGGKFTQPNTFRKAEYCTPALPVAILHHSKLRRLEVDEGCPSLWGWHAREAMGKYTRSGNGLSFSKSRLFWISTIYS